MPADVLASATLVGPRGLTSGLLRSRSCTKKLSSQQ
jgi:hypothetical protein